MPDDPDQLHRLGHVALEQGQLQRAVELLSRAVAFRPTGESCLHLADALRDAGRWDEAMAALRQGIQIAPDSPELHNNLGVLLTATNQFELAERALATALRLAPNHVDPALNLGNLYARGGHPFKAMQWYEQALKIDPNHFIAISNQAIVLQDLGLVDEAPARFKRALVISPQNAMVWSNLLLAMTRTALCDARAVAEAHRDYGRQIAGPWTKFQRPHTNDPDPDRRLRIAYLSADFRTHPVGLFIEPVLARHDHERIHVTCYSCSVEAESDAVTQRLRACADEWRNVATMNEIKLSEQIRGDGIDILIDLSGHTIGHRLLTLATKPAPVQVTYLGYPNTTGLSAIDYRITDPYADPPGMTEALHSEKLLRLEPCAWCYRPPADAPDVAPLPALKRGSITFGSFNGLLKLGDATLGLWSAALKAVPGSRLLLKTRNPFDEGTRQLALDRFARFGIASDRIELRRGGESLREHLAEYASVDVALDPFPYHGTTTTCEALFMGVPVVTLAGDCHAARVGVSLLNNVGLPQFIAQDAGQFARIAADQARDLPRLANLRAGLREQLIRSPLCDEAGIAREFESALRSIWREWCDRRREPA